MKQFSLLPMSKEELEEIGMLPSKKKAKNNTCLETQNATRRPLITLPQNNNNPNRARVGANQMKNNSTISQVDNLKGLKNTGFTKKSSLRKVLFSRSEIPLCVNKSLEAKQNNVDHSPLIPMEEIEEFLQKKNLMIDSFEEESLATVEEKVSVGESKIEDISPSTSGTTSFTSISTIPKAGVSIREELKENNSMSPNGRTLGACSRCKKLSEVLRRQNAKFKALQEKFDSFQQSFLSFSEFHNRSESELDSIFRENEGIFDKKSVSETQDEFPETKRCPSGLTPIRLTNKAFDLRIGVLKKKLKTDKTPKTKKAHSMYNGLRQRFEMLNSPRFEKETPSCQKSTDMHSISQKLQEQCLLLYETPRH